MPSKHLMLSPSQPSLTLLDFPDNLETGLLTQDFSSSEASPLSHLKIDEIVQTSKTLFQSGLLTALTYACIVAIDLICFWFIGQYGTSSDLSGASLGYTWANISCLGIFFSIDQGFVVLAARLSGARRYQELGMLFQKNISVLTLIAIPRLISCLFTDNIFTFFGIGYNVSVSAGLYLRSIVPSIVGMYLFNTMRFFLISQKIFHIQGIILVILLPIHVFWCYLFVDVFGMPVAGAGIAKSITDISAAIILFLCIKYKGVSKVPWVPFTKESWQHLRHFYSHVTEMFMVGGSLQVERIFYELSKFIIAIMNNPNLLGAHTIAINFMIIICSIPSGNSICMQSYIGNAVGEGSKEKVQRFMVAGLGLNLIVSGVNVFFIIFFNEDIAMFFTKDEETRNMLQNILFIYGLAHLADTYANHLGGMLRSAGRGREVVSDYIYSYIVVTLGLQCLFGIILDSGYIAVWVITILGMYLIFVLMIWDLTKLNWNEEITILIKSFHSEYSDKKAISIEMTDISRQTSANTIE